MRAAFAGTPEAARKACYRWQEDLPAAQHRTIDGAIHVHHSSRLPGGLTVQAYLATGRSKLGPDPVAPPGSEDWTPADRQHWLDTAELLARWDTLRTAQPRLNDRQLIGRFRQLAGDWARQRKLRISTRTLLRYRRRLDPSSPCFDGNVDRRGRAAEGARARGAQGTCSPEAWELFLSLYLAQNGLSLKAAWDFVAGEARQHNWPWPSIVSIRRRVTQEIPRAALVLYRQGRRRYEADCVPKLQRDYDFPAGTWWSLDGRKLDIQGRVPGAHGKPKRERFVLTGVLDMRSRMLVGWDLRVTENADGILAGVKRALRDYGAPEDVHYDCGQAYKAALGSPRGTQRQRDYFADPRIGSVFAQLTVQVHNSLPYHAWAKQIESTWSKLKNGFDRWFWSFWGGSPGERPERADQLTKLRIDELPTVDDLRQAFAIYVDEYHATEQGGVGTYGLAPKLVMEQYRGPVRRVDPALLDLVCCRTVGPVKVGRDGVYHDNLLYRLTVDDLVKYQGRRVTLRIDPDVIDRLTVCDEQGHPLCIAARAELSGATREDLRAAARRRARMNKLVRQHAPARDFLLETPTTQILQMKRAHAQARMAAQRKELPDPEAPAVQIVRPDLAAAASKLAQRSHSRAPSPEPRAPNPFDRLAELAEPSAPGSRAPAFDRAAAFERLGDIEPAEDETSPHPSAAAWQQLSEVAG